MHVCTASVLALLLAVPAYAGPSDSSQSKQSDRSTGERSSPKIPRPDDCAHIKAGTADSTADGLFLTWTSCAGR
jgi:hypothetical protein